MRKFLMLLGLLVAFTATVQAQIYIDGKELREETIQFMEIEFFNTVGTANVRMFIDYGQNVGFLDRRNRIVSDKKGKALIFNSPVHGLNWMYEKGYEVLSVYNPKSGGTTVNTELVYLLKKAKDRPVVDEE